MRNSQTSRRKTKYKKPNNPKKKGVYYYSEVGLQDEKVVYNVIEYPNKEIVWTFDFEDEADEMVRSFNQTKPFGDIGIPSFLKGGFG
jgi:hypothetical protein